LKKKQSNITNNKLATLTHISQIQEDLLDPLEMENLTQDSILLNALWYNPAISATAALQLVLQMADIMNKDIKHNSRPKIKDYQQNSYKEKK
jgi:hypothetical protein